MISGFLALFPSREACSSLWQANVDSVGDGQGARHGHGALLPDSAFLLQKKEGDKDHVKNLGTGRCDGERGGIVDLLSRLRVFVLAVLLETSDGVGLVSFGIQLLTQVSKPHSKLGQGAHLQSRPSRVTLPLPGSLLQILEGNRASGILSAYSR